jgi:hypothetical protein
MGQIRIQEAEDCVFREKLLDCGFRFCKKDKHQVKKRFEPVVQLNQHYGRRTTPLD